MSDRFFLNSVEGLTDRGQSVYLFNRRQYMQNLLQEDVKCVIMSTYGFNVQSSQLEISDLLGSGSMIPTLIIHGDNRKLLAKASILRKERARASCSRRSESYKKHKVSDASCGILFKVEGSAESIKVEKIDVSEVRNSIRNSGSRPSASSVDNSGTSLLPLAKSHPGGDIRDTLQETVLNFPDNVFIERVRSQWSRPETSPKKVGLDTYNGNSSRNNVLHTEGPPSDNNYKKSIQKSQDLNQGTIGGTTLGVHHAKYILTFTNKGVHVLISTSNLTPQTSAEATWTDYFPLQGTKSSIDGNDFGFILQNFILEQSKQILKLKRKEYNTNDESGTDGNSTYHEYSDPSSFLKKYTGVSDISSTYDFSNAQVDLVTSVPSRTPLEPPSQDLIRRLFRNCHRKKKQSNHYESLNHYCAILQPPCKKCQKESARLGVRASVLPNSEVKVEAGGAKDNNDSNNNNDNYYYNNSDDNNDSNKNNNDNNYINNSNNVNDNNKSSKNSKNNKNNDDNSNRTSNSSVFEKTQDYSMKGEGEMKVKVEGNLMRSVAYGLQRCRNVLIRNSTLLPRHLNHKDELIIQPTSISNGIDLGYIGYFLSNLMPEESWGENYATYEMLRLDCCRFVWPKLSFIRKCAARTDCRKEIFDNHPGANEPYRTKLFRSPDTESAPVPASVRKNGVNTRLEKFEIFRNCHEIAKTSNSNAWKRGREALYSDDEALDVSSDEEDACGNALFFRLKNLALMEVDLQSRMYTYEANKAEAIKFAVNISPHIKSYTRLMSSDSSSYSTSDRSSAQTPVKEKKEDPSPVLNEYFKEQKTKKGLDEDKGLVGTTVKDSLLCSCHPVAWTLMTSSCLSKGKSYKALNPKCYVHGRTATHPQTDSTDILKRTFSSVEATINKSSTDDGDKDVVDNIVILPFPFNVLGGVPYYEEIGARFSHRPFFNGSAKEVAKFGYQLDLPCESPMECSDTQDSLEQSQGTEENIYSSSLYTDRLKVKNESSLTDDIKMEIRSPLKSKKVEQAINDISMSTESKSLPLPRIFVKTEKFSTKKIVRYDNFFRPRPVCHHSPPEDIHDKIVGDLNEKIAFSVRNLVKIEKDSAKHIMKNNFHDELQLSSSFASDFMC